ncbi:MAG: phosphate ABC transporter permease PstA [Sphingomicrobium sp.]
MGRPTEMAIPVRRRAADVVAFVFASMATAFGLFWLFWILWTTLAQGAAALTPALFTQMTPPPGASGGLINAFYGSAVMIMLALVVGTPLGIAAGTYLAEHGRYTRLAALVSFINDILLSAPSIVIGLFIYEIVVRSMGHFSGFAGALALAMILLPIVVRTTEEALRLVPDQMREAGFALGMPRWRVTSQIIYKAAQSAILTGVLLGAARIAGETAPLLFTALNNQFWSSSLNAPLANVPVVIFQYAMSPYDEWHTLAWAGAFVLTAFVLVLNLLVRTLARKGTHNE